MSQYLLLLDKAICPKCRRKAVPPYYPAQCRNCGMMLFLSGNDFAGYERNTGWREYWVWTGKDKGWVHRSHIFDESAKPLDRVYDIPKLDADYGTPEYQKKKVDNSRAELKDHIKTLKRAKNTIRVVK